MEQMSGNFKYLYYLKIFKMSENHIVVSCIILLILRRSSLHTFTLINVVGFLPRDTAKHHQDCVLKVLKEALDQANIKPNEIDVVCYTKGSYLDHFIQFIKYNLK